MRFLLSGLVWHSQPLAIWRPGEGGPRHAQLWAPESSQAALSSSNGGNDERGEFEAVVPTQESDPAAVEETRRDSNSSPG